MKQRVGVGRAQAQAGNGELTGMARGSPMHGLQQPAKVSISYKENVPSTAQATQVIDTVFFQSACVEDALR